MAEASIHTASTSGAEGDLPIPPNLEARLDAFRQRLWSVKIAEGALAGIAGLGIAYLLVFALDRFADTPALVRALLLVGGWALPAVGLPLRWYRWVQRQRSLEQIARLLRRRYPRLGDELLGIVELSHTASPGNSRPLVEAAMRQVDERIAARDFDDAVPSQRYGAWLSAALSVLVLSAALALTVSDAAANALARWTTPWKPVERYTFARLESVPEHIIVPYAESFPLSPALAEDTEWKPDTASLRLPGSTRLTTALRDDAYRFELPPQKEEGSLGLRVGDEYRRIAVEPLPRPELTDLEAILQLPDYLRYDEDSVVPIRGGSVSVVEGAKASFAGTVSRQIADAGSDGRPARIDGDRFVTEPEEITEPVQRTLTWTDVNGLRARSPLTLDVTPVEDRAPDVFARPLTAERVVLEDEVVSFDVSATDDFGVKRIGLQWYGPADGADRAKPKEAVIGDKPVAAGDPEKRELQARATFSAAREGVAPRTLQVRAFAEDFLPDRERSYSNTFVLHVLSPADHADWLTGEFGKWFRSAREVYERERQLHETNRSLRSLSPQELDRPANRRRLEKQASEESANARRLDSLTEAGRDLVRQATKNDEFDAERLESWTDMVRTLEEVAEDRMPSVADLLDRASRAESASGDATPAEESSEFSESSEPSEASSEASSEESSASRSVSSSGEASEASDEPPQSREKSEPSSPGVSDREKPLAGTESKESTAPGESPSSLSQSPLGLPRTTLQARGDGEGGQPPPPQSPAQEKLDEAVGEQEELLEEFAKVADRLQEILSSLEASTFVKRFKAASRAQQEIVSRLNDTLGGGFGLPRKRIEQQLRSVGEKMARRQEAQSEFVHHIQTDLEAYYQRKQDLVFKNVLDQMKDLSVVSDLSDIGNSAENNLSGRSIAASEYWADTLDRWAEELVAAAGDQKSQQKSGGEKDSLPPEIVLRVMQALRDEMDLRDETREMQSARPGLAPDVYESKVRPLEQSQTELRDDVDDVVEDIRALDDGDRQFGKEIQLLNLVSDTMRQARAVLARPDTGPEAIAAQTEAIELLLQSKRQQSSGGGGGGGGGSSPGGGGSAGSSGTSLSDIQLGPGSDESSEPDSRDVDQSTGRAGRDLPEEFRRGLDNYFNVLESN